MPMVFHRSPCLGRIHDADTLEQADLWRGDTYRTRPAGTGLRQMLGELLELGIKVLDRLALGF